VDKKPISKDSRKCLYSRGREKGPEADNNHLICVQLKSFIDILELPPLHVQGNQSSYGVICHVEVFIGTFDKFFAVAIRREFVHSPLHSSVCKK